MRALALKAKAQDLPDLEAFAKHHAKVLFHVAVLAHTGCVVLS